MTDRTAIYAGSFDPVTNGHLDVVRQACRLVPRLVLAIGVHPGKAPLFSPAEKVEIMGTLAVGRIVPRPAVGGRRAVMIRRALRPCPGPRGPVLVALRPSTRLHPSFVGRSANLVGARTDEPVQVMPTPRPKVVHRVKRCQTFHLSKRPLQPLGDFT